MPPALVDSTGKSIYPAGEPASAEEGKRAHANAPVDTKGITKC